MKVLTNHLTFSKLINLWDLHYLSANNKYATKQILVRNPKWFLLMEIIKNHKLCKLLLSKIKLQILIHYDNF